ncbi:hypothetical protein FGO68_gene10950 [Halteria grandinella]|uniref:Uncharacterized protein n=1 Tax=Halteria grandinella TaxID=5974 RepID=A0A8J8P7K6_HALGN|nr:hypothetical protein FGO68_gene10950 [Halteria grandinella]
MSIDLFQAQRDTEIFWKDDADTQRIGPGSYNLNKVPFLSRKQYVGQAPFSSNVDRFCEIKDQMKRSQSAASINMTKLKIHGLNPICPKIYTADCEHKANPRSKVQKTHRSSSFISKVPRLAPAMALSAFAPELIPSSIHNPGPGSYEPMQQITTDQERQQLLKKIVENQRARKEIRNQKLKEQIEAVQPQGKRVKIGSIPGKKVYKHGFTGEKGNQPGPEVYNPNDEFIRSKSQTALFSRSRTQRETFRTRIDEAPGPQSYNVTELKTKTFNRYKESASFMAKVPSYIELLIDKEKMLLPGPGAYFDDTKSTQSNESKTNKKRTMKQVKGNQLTTVTCQEDEHPGPGAYQQDDRKLILQQKLGQDPKKFNFPQALSKQKRPKSNKKEHNQTLSLPGPGSYIDISNPLNSSLSKTLVKLQQAQELSETMGTTPLVSFGSHTERFKHMKVIEDAKEFKELNFGLGSTQTIINHSQLDKLKLKYQMRQQTRKQFLEKHKEYLRKVQKPEFILLQEQEKCQNSVTDTLPKPIIPSSFFKSSLDRFGNPFNNVKGTELENLPGPGSYELHGGKKRNSYSYRPTNFPSTQRKVFDMKQDQTNQINAPQEEKSVPTMVKKTFNVRLAANLSQK